MFSDVSIQLRHFIFANFLPLLAMLFSGISNNLLPIPTRYRRWRVRADRHRVIVDVLHRSALNTIWRSKRARPKIYSFACTG